MHYAFFVNIYLFKLITIHRTWHFTAGTWIRNFLYIQINHIVPSLRGECCTITLYFWRFIVLLRVTTSNNRFVRIQLASINKFDSHRIVTSSSYVLIFHNLYIIVPQYYNVTNITVHVKNSLIWKSTNFYWNLSLISQNDSTNSAKYIDTLIFNLNKIFNDRNHYRKLSSFKFWQIQYIVESYEVNVIMYIYKFIRINYNIGV